MIRDDGNPHVFYNEGSRPPREYADAVQQAACIDCQCSVYLCLVRLAANRTEWRPEYFHDEACPTLAAVRADPDAKQRLYAGIEQRLAALGYATSHGLGELVDFEPPSSVYDLEPIELRQS